MAQFNDPILTQTRRWSGPVIQFSTTARCRREKIFNHMINIVLLLTMEISFIFFIMSHPKTLNNTLGPYILRNHFLLTKHIFLCEEEIQIFGFACSFGLQFHLFWCSVAFHVVTPSLTQRITQEGGGESFHATQETGGKSGIRFS